MHVCGVYMDVYVHVCGAYMDVYVHVCDVYMDVYVHVYTVYVYIVFACVCTRKIEYVWHTSGAYQFIHITLCMDHQGSKKDH